MRDITELVITHPAPPGGGGGGGGAPDNAQYLVAAADPTLTAERVTTDTPTVAWDHTVAGQAKANVPDDAITLAKLANLASQRILGRTTAGAGDPEALTPAQATAILDIFTDLLKGLVPASGGGTTTFLRADGAFAAPNGGTPAAHATTHQDGGSDEVSVTGLSGLLADAQKVTVRKNTGADVGTRKRLNLIEGTNVTLTVADDAGGDEVDITIASSGGGGGGDNITVNGTAVADADLDDATPAAVGTGKNVKWQQDGGSPANVSAYVEAASASVAGVVTTGAQTLAGDKTIQDGLITQGEFLLAGILSPSALSGDTDNWAPTNFHAKTVVRIDLSASINLSGLDAGTDGEVKKLYNITTDFIIVLTHEDPASSAANRLNFGNAIPCYILCPGDSATFWYDGTTSRWRFDHGHHPATLSGQFDVFTDCTGTPVAGGSQPLTMSASGTGASGQLGTFGNNATEKAVGEWQADTGTTASGRAHWSSGSAATFAPAQAGVLLLCRVTVETLSDGTNTYQVRVGLHDGEGGTDVTDGVYWEYDQATTTDWRTACAGAGTRTKTTVTGFTVGTTYVILGIWINPGWTRADFFHSTDSIAFIVSADGTKSGADMPTSTELLAIALGINKTVGTATRNFDVDWAGWRFANTQR